MKKSTDILISHYEFHLMRIKRTPYKSKSQVKEYHKDLYILNGKVVEDWWRKKGHNLCPEDIQDIINSEKLDVLIVGTGNDGKMKISREVKNLLIKRKIPLIEAPTAWAVKVYNSLRGDVFGIRPISNIAAAFHLTC